MIISLLITLILIIAGLWVFMQLYDLVENDLLQTLFIAGYSIFTMWLLFNWFSEYILYQLNV